MMLSLWGKSTWLHHCSLWLAFFYIQSLWPPEWDLEVPTYPHTEWLLMWVCVCARHFFQSPRQQLCFHVSAQNHKQTRISICAVCWRRERWWNQAHIKLDIIKTPGTALHIPDARIQRNTHPRALLWLPPALGRPTLLPSLAASEHFLDPETSSMQLHPETHTRIHEHMV